MEESKELQGFYKIFRAVIYISVLMEFFEYAIDPAMLDHWGGILIDIHGRIKQWMIYNDGNLVYSKIATFLLICITCIGTRNKKHLEFDARRQVLYPLISGLFLIVFSVWLYHHPMETRLYTLPLNIIFYMATTLVGVYISHWITSRSSSRRDWVKTGSTLRMKVSSRAKRRLRTSIA